ncbi:MAG: penicillin-binding protein activator [Pseudomonadota bacterium]
MQIKRSLKVLLGCLAAGLFAGCNTPMPCDPGTGGLCTPIIANTSAPETGRRADAAPAPSPTQTMPAAPKPAAAVQTRPVDMAGAGGVPPAARPGAVRIALMLPLRSEALGKPAEAVRAGFMAAFERDSAGFIVSLVQAGDTPDQVVSDYANAVQNNDIVVGPLARSAVTALASSQLVLKPTIALNNPDANTALPDLMLVMGLSIEAEARQVANMAADEQHTGQPLRALIVSGTSAWQRRIAQAIQARWKQLKFPVELVELADSNGYLSEAALAQLKARIDAAPPNVLFAALDADQAGQMRTNLDSALPFYGTSAVNPGLAPGTAMAQLDGMRLMDLPWLVQSEHPAVRLYPRTNPSRAMLDMDRLYALGIDAYRVAREVALRPNQNIMVNGVTGRLRVKVGAGPSQFSRFYPSVVYQNGAFVPLNGKN